MISDFYKKIVILVNMSQCDNNGRIFVEFRFFFTKLHFFLFEDWVQELAGSLATHDEMMRK